MMISFEDKEYCKRVVDGKLQFALMDETDRLKDTIYAANWGEIKHHLDNISLILEDGRTEYERMMREIDAINSNREVKV